MAKDGRDWVRLQDAGPPATMLAERRRRGGPGRRLVLGGAGVLLVVVIGAGLWLGSVADEQQMAGGLPPLVAADTSPTKHRPEDPGGMEVPNQQMLVYERVSPNPTAPRVERLLPPPEQPVAKPAPPPLPAAPQSAAAPDGEGAAPPMAPPTLPDVATADAPAVAPADEPPAAAAPAPSTPPEVIVVEEQVGDPAADAAAAADTPAADDGAATAAADTPVPAQKPAMAVLAAKAVAAAVPAANAAPAPASDPAPREAVVPPVMTAAAVANGFRIQLASFSNEAGAQTAWKKLASTHDGVLGKLRPVVVRVDLDGGVRYRLQAGSFADAESARRACDALKARKQDCLVVSDS